MSKQVEIKYVRQGFASYLYALMGLRGIVIDTEGDMFKVDIPNIPQSPLWFFKDEVELL